MEEFARKLFDELEINLNAIVIIESDRAKRMQDAIETIIIALEKLRLHIEEFGFKNESEEIFFFKTVKPPFVCRLIYYNEIYTIESNRPVGGQKYLQKYYDKELIKLKSYFIENIEFYNYFRNGNTYLDSKYFLRGQYDIKLKLDSFCFQADDRFTTSHDFKLGKIIANDLIQVYLEKEIVKLENKAAAYNVSDRQVQKWTGSKIALIELIYALHAEGVFNNGTTDLKETAKFFEGTFDIDLGQFHRTFFEMRARKSERTKFLNSLRDGLIRRMDEVDE